jgi:hypothetical protein
VGEVSGENRRAGPLGCLSIVLSLVIVSFLTFLPISVHFSIMFPFTWQLLKCSFDEPTLEVLSTINNTYGIIRALLQFADDGITIGSTTALLPEANDALVNNAPVVDGESGDTNFPYGNLKPIATVGERSVCNDGSAGTKLTGPPDGNGAYLVDDNTVRVLVQSESYGPINEPKEQT